LKKHFIELVHCRKS